MTSYDRAVSSLEIVIEDEILGSGAFGTVHIGRWNGARVAVKQLARGTPRQVSLEFLTCGHSDVQLIEVCVDANQGDRCMAASASSTCSFVLSGLH